MEDGRAVGVSEGEDDGTTEFVGVPDGLKDGVADGTVDADGAAETVGAGVSKMHIRNPKRESS